MLVCLYVNVYIRATAPFALVLCEFRSTTHVRAVSTIPTSIYIIYILIRCNLIYERARQEHFEYVYCSM
jgi:hypothetical protein